MSQMINGLYQSAAGLLTQMENHETIAGNLAASNAAGHRRTQISFESYLNPKDSPPSDPQALSQTANSLWPARFPITKTMVDFTQGRMEADGNPSHLALVGEGFFAIQLPNDQGTVYTRNGTFQVSNTGALTTGDGWQVLGEGGSPITLPKPRIPMKVGETGEIVQEGSSVGKLQIVNFKDPARDLVWHGGGYFIAKDASVQPESKPGETRLLQGNVESSNVNLVEEMVAMIQATRSYEANQKMMQAQDDTLERIISKVPVPT